MKTVIVLILVMITVFSPVSSARGDRPFRKFDEIYGMNWEDTMARLDNYAMQLQHEPDMFGVVVVHGRQHARRYDHLDWATCIKDYLLKRRGISSDRLFLMKAQARENTTVELWISEKKSLPDSGMKALQARKGKAGNWRRLCGL